MSAGVTDIEVTTTGEPIDNDHFTSIGLTDEWILRRTGIRNRWWMSPSRDLADVAAEVCGPLVSRNAGIGALLLVSTSAEQTIPGLAQQVATRAGLPRNVLALDMNAACSGFVYGVVMALGMCESGQVDAVVVCSVEAMSRMIDRTDRSTAILFGDGSGAVVVADRPGFRPSKWVAGCDGAGADLMYRNDAGIVLDGQQVYDRATRMMAGVAAELCDATPAPTVVIGHQANARILDKVRRSIPDKSISFVDVIESFGNTSSASIPLAWGTSLEDRSIPAAGRAALVSYGAGETWGGVSVDYEMRSEGAR
ncbi:ketoacyl-ACP synthase III [Millisia brevis]|uniref:ketoacyl-ACP synthase III n=1 Tax=Millisia brevis TaxID=264148 RepID=UPI00082AED8E|nr:ketoacyl-ACP synthase III [Millisia brevis]